MDGNSHYYLMLEGMDDIFDVSVYDHLDIIRYETGDEITLGYEESDSETVQTVVSVE